MERFTLINKNSVSSVTVSMALSLVLVACRDTTPSSAPRTASQTRPPSTARTQYRTMTVTEPARYGKYSYKGQADLGLTVAIVQAGGGYSHFEGTTLFRSLAGRDAGREKARLEKMYGKAKIAAFMQTLTFSMRELTQLLRDNHIAMPPSPRLPPSNGHAVALAIYHDGIMPTGRFDCGYMMDHLMSHPIHVVLMHDINSERGHGASHNANFHMLLTRFVVDLKNFHPRPQGGHANSAHYQPKAKA